MRIFKLKPREILERYYVDGMKDIWENSGTFRKWENRENSDDGDEHICCIFDSDIDEGIIRFGVSMSYYDEGNIEPLSWALEREITREKDPEYYL